LTAVRRLGPNNWATTRIESAVKVEIAANRNTGKPGIVALCVWSRKAVDPGWRRPGHSRGL
jgi:hypothetical protein